MVQNRTICQVCFCGKIVTAYAVCYVQSIKKRGGSFKKGHGFCSGAKDVYHVFRMSGHVQPARRFLALPLSQFELEYTGQTVYG
jgi:hypothetical protein